MIECISKGIRIIKKSLRTPTNECFSLIIWMIESVIENDEFGELFHPIPYKSLTEPFQNGEHISTRWSKFDWCSVH